MIKKISSNVVVAMNPLITFALIAFNQEDYVGDAITAAFAQTYTPLEIVLSDDCSSDSTFEIMQRAAAGYKGPHRIVLNRNRSNLNIGGHVNAVAKIARGELIVLAAGDDISVPSRTQQLFKHWDTLGRSPVVLCSDFEAIDAASKPIALKGEGIYRGPFSTENMARGEIRVLGATTAVTKDVFSCFSPLHPTVIHEDRVLPFRALLLRGGVELVDKKLVLYRVEGGISRGKAKSGCDYLRHHLPALLERTLPDAVQRLSDLMTILPSDVALSKACKATIVVHHACIELSRARGFDIDLIAAKWLLRGVRICALLRLYLKLRFLVIYNFYYRKRFIK
jgi:glycosyltransferase involved in cell wall biosynthesis